MCRLVAIVASELTEFALCLREAPRSLASLSHEHPDGWGIAIHGRDHGGHWELYRGTEPAAHDDRFHEIAAQSRGQVLVAHIRQKTVGPTRIENTHPFERDGWVFAHNGTVTDQAYLRADCSTERLAQIEGDTDSELLFAFLLTRLDRRGLLHAHAPHARRDAERVVSESAAELRDARVGAFNFLLSDGASTFVHRFGRSLYVLERRPGDPVRERRDVTPEAAILTRWTRRRHAVLVASERLTDEPWREVADGSFLRIDRSPVPTIVSEARGRAA